jgi:F0F1-type ATP synthase assembly protein I
MEKKQEKTGRLRAWRQKQAKAYQSYLRTSAVGLEFGLAIATGALIGYFADKYFSSSPYGLLVGVIIGSIAAVKALWAFVKDYVKKNGSSDDE